MEKYGIKKADQGLMVRMIGFLQDDQCLGGLSFINCLDLVDKYMLEASIERHITFIKML